MRPLWAVILPAIPASPKRLYFEQDGSAMSAIPREDQETGFSKAPRVLGGTKHGWKCGLLAVSKKREKEKPD